MLGNLQKGEMRKILLHTAEMTRILRILSRLPERNKAEQASSHKILRGEYYTIKPAQEL